MNPSRGDPMVCETCGTENRAGSRFCDHCGSPMSLSCPACGVPNRADALFCASCGTGLHPETPAAQTQPAAERRQVSVLFADLVGFTAYADGRDPEHVRALQQRYFDAASEAISRHGGTVEKFIGDAVMAVWGTPVAKEDDAQRAVRAAIEVVKAVEALGHELTARAGVVTAEAAVTIGATNQGMVAGDMVNTASRLQSSAEPGHVLADQPTVQAASSTIAFGPVDDLTLKGKVTPMRAWRALRVLQTRSADLVEPPFVGRAEELRRLKDILHAAGRDQRIRLVSITGPAGIGKSRLIEELGSYADGVAEPIYWHAGRSPSYGEGIAFWALGEMIRRRAGLAEGDDGETTRAAIDTMLAQFVREPDEVPRVQAALLTLLGFGEMTNSESLFPAWRIFFERIAARGSAAVLVFEDLQWADSGTLEFIEHLLDWSRNHPILVITLARPELLDVRPGWGTARSNSTAMALEAMPEGDIRELLVGLMPGLPEPQVAAIVRRAEGMPLYAVEMVRALLADGRIERRGDGYVPTEDLATLPIPASLRSLIASRLDALVAEDRALLQDASVLGLAFGAEALASVNGLPVAELEHRLLALVRRELLEIEADPRSPERGQYRFVQSLIREVAYDTLALRERRSRHLAAARQLEASESEEAAGALASHYLAAYHASDEGPEADAVAAQARVSLRSAADRAARLGAHEQAVQNLEHALTITTGLRERAELLERATTSATAAALSNAPDFARDAVETYRAIGEHAREIEATASLVDVLLDAAQVTEAEAVVRAAMPEVEARDAATWAAPEARLFAVQARVEMRLDRDEAAVRAADRALVIAERRGLDHVAAMALVNKGSALSQAGRRREGVALLEGAVRMAEHGGWTHLELRGRVNLAQTLGDDDPGSAQVMRESSLELAERIGDVAHFVTAAVGFTDGAISEGRPGQWDVAVDLIERALMLATAHTDRVNLLWQKSTIQSLRGQDPAETIASLEHHASQSTDPRNALAPHIARAWRDFAAGRWSEAAEQARAGMELEPFASPWVGIIIAHAALATADVEAVRSLTVIAEGVPLTGRFIDALRGRYHGILAALEGHEDVALTRFTEALSALREVRSGFDWALTAHLAAVGLPAQPVTLGWAREAREMLEAMGAHAITALVDQAIATGLGSRQTSAASSPRGASTEDMSSRA